MKLKLRNREEVRNFYNGYRLSKIQKPQPQPPPCSSRGGYDVATTKVGELFYVLSVSLTLNAGVSTM
ncbi:MAG: hypothetical protein RLZZ184_3025 [Cyanobacteriota bacterium]|jgi:hypothetical protein